MHLRVHHHWCKDKSKYLKSQPSSVCLFIYLPLILEVNAFFRLRIVVVGVDRTSAWINFGIYEITIGMNNSRLDWKSRFGSTRGFPEWSILRNWKFDPKEEEEWWSRRIFKRSYVSIDSERECECVCERERERLSVYTTGRENVWFSECVCT
jgi:hypothetical protein